LNPQAQFRTTQKARYMIKIFSKIITLVISKLLEPKTHPNPYATSFPATSISSVLSRKSQFAALIFILAALASANAHAWISIKNTTEYTVSGSVVRGTAFCPNKYYSVAPGQTVSVDSGGTCLVTGIYGTLSGIPKGLEGTGRKNYGEKMDVVHYDSTGTGYSSFLIAPYGGAYRIFSNQEFERVTNTKLDKSPGFYFVNKTAWPVAYSLDQVGCLYHGIVPTGVNGAPGVMKVDTGAVWFTLRAHIQPDGQNPQSDLDCVEPVAELIGDVGLAVFSGGYASAAKQGAKLVGKTVLKEALKAGLKKAGKKIATKLVKDFAKQELGSMLKDYSNVTMLGQYAGYEWPFRCSAMPIYEITGGPEIYFDETGEASIAEGDPFTVTKVNDCGNDMMLASPKSKSVPPDPKYFLPRGSAAVAAAPTVPEAGAGYELFFDGRLVSGPDARTYTWTQALDNCKYNTGARPGTRVGCAYNGSAFTPDATAAPVASARGTTAMPALTTGPVSLLGAHGKYVGAEANGAAAVTRAAIGPAEQLFLSTNADGTVSFRSARGKYLVAEANGVMNANRDAIGPWEKFVVSRNADGSVSFRTAHGKFVVAEADGRLNANRDAIGPWESFRLSSMPGTTATAEPPAAGAAALIYGGQYRLLNGYANWTGGYLDTNNAGCEGNLLCVSTANSPSRDGLSGTWIILPATAGRAVGQPVVAGDEIYLANMYPQTPPNGQLGATVGNFGGFLDTRNAGCRGDLLCVSTSAINNRDPSRTSVWKIEAVSGAGPLTSTTAVTLRNAYSNYGGGYLNTNNAGCQGNRYCVSTSAARERVAGSGTTLWMILPK
jgi:hypothetical protein